MNSIKKESGLTNQAFQGDEQTYGSSAAAPGGKSESESESDELGDCALFCVPLRPLSKLRGPKCFLVFLSVAAFMQGLCINGFVNVVITSIERRFGLQSTQTGLIASSYDIGSLVIMIPVSYLGGRAGASKPRQGRYFAPE